MVQYVLKSDLALRELEHVQVDSPGLAYLFYDRHGHHGLTKEAALAICSHLADAFAEWIGRSAHFDAVPLLLVEGCQCMTAAQERCRQCICNDRELSCLERVETCSKPPKHVFFALPNLPISSPDTDSEDP